MFGCFMEVLQEAVPNRRNPRRLREFEPRETTPGLPRERGTEYKELQETQRGKNVRGILGHKSLHEGRTQYWILDNVPAEWLIQAALWVPVSTLETAVVNWLCVAN